MTEQINTPRVQLRWERPDGGPDEWGYLAWKCHYELVLPLREHDIRREDQDCKVVRSHLVAALKPPTTRNSTGEPCRNSDGTYHFDTPFRDGAHAQWDSEVLGGLPIVVIAVDGTVIPEPADNAKKRTTLRAENEALREAFRANIAGLELAVGVIVEYAGTTEQPTIKQLVERLATSRAALAQSGERA